jgi:hypothetical protein
MVSLPYLEANAATCVYCSRDDILWRPWFAVHLGLITIGDCSDVTSTEVHWLGCPGLSEGFQGPALAGRCKGGVGSRGGRKSEDAAKISRLAVDNRWLDCAAPATSNSPHGNGKPIRRQTTKMLYETIGIVRIPSLSRTGNRQQPSG